MNTTRIYEVQSTDEGVVRLIEATSQAAAIRHVAKVYTATIPNGLRIAELVAGGMKVERA